VFGSPILDVAIGLMLIYLVLALACTSINEYIAQVLSLRAAVLWNAVTGLFQRNPAVGIAFVQKLYQHDLINALSPAKPGALPSYIPSHVFSLALTDHLGLHDVVSQQATPSVLTALQSVDVTKLPAEVLETLRPLAVAAGGDLDRFRLNVETWYDAAMERAGGWYKKRVQTIIFCVALVVAIAGNADTLMLANMLWKNPTARAQLAAAAEKVAKPASTPALQGSPAASPTVATSTSAPAQAATASIPGAGLADLDKQTLKDAQGQVEGVLGWASADKPTDPRALPAGAGAWFVKIAGLLITAFAASLGAPFWFDVLNKFMNVRSAGASPAEQPRRPTEVPKPQTRIESGQGDN